MVFFSFLYSGADNIRIHGVWLLVSIAFGLWFYLCLLRQKKAPDKDKAFVKDE